MRLASNVRGLAYFVFVFSNGSGQTLKKSESLGKAMLAHAKS
jgi:hypothetical protein